MFKIIMLILCVACGVLKFLNVVIAIKTAGGGTWSPDLFQGFFLFGFLAVVGWPF